ncbi:Uncharacterized membrane protein [Palleronia salina]|uniref:Uncharacterized membrane protein n=2 Tax=Palleronia TaxID=315422 RepID=A0A1M6JA78_9RHOB|nr:MULTISPECIES: DUF2244 domain-containing protein [Palleronia]SEN95695.1 Uncharacterized membrane protein [Palleronia pelagia]SHJ43608.1 Uncharacterized membrane protein [Palleronia salina]
MPVVWTKSEKAPASSGAFSHAAGDQPLARVRLWPNRSLPRSGFVAFIGFTYVMILLPLLGVLGTPVLWGLLPFMMLALWGIYAAIQRNYRDGETTEELCLWSDHLALRREDRNRPPRLWEANPFWVKVNLIERAGPVPFYLTLSGAGREVEVGAFLSAEERQSLYDDLSRVLKQV